MDQAYAGGIDTITDSDFSKIAPINDLSSLYTTNLSKEVIIFM